MKRIIYILLCVLICIMMVLGSFGFGASTTVEAATGSTTLFNGFNSSSELQKIGAISLAGSSTLSLDTTNKYEGASSLKIDMAATNSDFISPYGYYFDIDGSYFDITKYNYVEVMYKANSAHAGTYQFQIHLIDTAVSTVGSGYDYNGGITLQTNWNRFSQSLATPYNVFSGMGNNVNRIRFIMLNYTGAYVQVDMNIDGLVLLDNTYINARATAEANVDALIATLPAVTESNYASLADEFAAIDAALANGNSTYINFMPTRLVEYNSKKATYNSYVTGSKGNHLLFNGFNSSSDLQKVTPIYLAGTNAVRAIDSSDKYEGAASLKINMDASNAGFINPYAYYFDIDGSTFNINSYAYAEVVYKSEVDMAGTYNFQLHLINTAVSTDGSGYDYDGGVSLDGIWHRQTTDLSTPYTVLAGMNGQVNRIRCILLNYNGRYIDVDMNLDGLVLFDAKYYEGRANAEQAVVDMINALPAVTATNYLSLASTFAKIEGAIESGNQLFINFMPANYSTYAAKKALYEKYVAGVDMDFTMPNFFAHNMMFQQNKTMNLFGTSTSGKNITAELYNGSTLVTSASATVDALGEWTVSLPARKGSYTAYTIIVKENGVARKQLNNVLVGELWLAAGQSNMEYRLDWEINGAEEMATTNDSYLRVLLMVGDHFGSSGTTVEPARTDIYGATWTDASKGTNIASMSSNGYYAAKVMREKLDVPVGIINAALGSTNIQTWLSRSAIEGNEIVKSALELNNMYKTEEQSASDPGVFTDMSAMYNTKIAPLEGMNVGGIFWCQGESNVDGKPNETGFYNAAIKTLASSYGKVLGHENGDMPLIVINIANQPYQHDPQIIPKWIEEIADAAATNKNIVNIPIYDVGYTYSNPPDPAVAWPIHPNTKKPGGTRAGLAAAHNFCGYGSADYYAPTVKSYQVKDGAIYVTFDGVSTGLTTLDNSIGVHGFTISEKDGLYIPAKAEIVSKNVVKIWHEDIKNPKNFTYAFNSHSITANLCNSYSVPAVPYRSNRNMTGYFCSNDWMYCEDTSVFINIGASGQEEPTWMAGVASQTLSTLTVDNNVKYEGTGSLKISYTTSKSTTTGATLFYGYYLMPFPAQTYKTISVAIKNPDSRDKNFSLLFGTQTGVELWKAPLSDTNSTKTYSATAKANSDFTIYTFALEDLQGLNTTATCNLANCNRMEIMVEDSKSGTVYVDAFSVGVLSAEDKVAADKAAAQTVVNAINALPEKVTATNASAVSAAREAYEALTDAQKAYVTNLAKLEDAEYQLAHPYTLGDVDESGDISAADALLALQHSVDKITLTGNKFSAADVNGDGKVEAEDALLILQYTVDKITSFPTK